MPCVSVIIPIYNSNHLLSKTTESTLDQTYKEREISGPYPLILLLDGSMIRKLKYSIKGG